MTRGTELRRVIDVLHYRFGMPVKVGENLRIGHNAWNPLALFVHKDGGHTHDEAAVAQLRLHALYGVAGGARQPIAVEGPIQGRTGIHSSAKYRDRVMAAVTVPGKLNSFGAKQNIHARPVERCAESIGVQRLAPLVIRLLVAVTAIFGIWKGPRLQEIVAFRSGIAGHSDFVFGKWKVVGLAYLIRVGLARFRLVRGGVYCSERATDRPD